jgi:hypothetical protein
MITPSATVCVSSNIILGCRARERWLIGETMASLGRQSPRSLIATGDTVLESKIVSRREPEICSDDGRTSA